MCLLTKIMCLIIFTSVTGRVVCLEPDNEVLFRYLKIEEQIIENKEILGEETFLSEVFTKHFIKKIASIKDQLSEEEFCEILINAKPCIYDVFYHDEKVRNNIACLNLIGEYALNRNKYVANKIVLFRKDDQIWKINEIRKERMTWHDFGMKLLRGSRIEQAFKNNCATILSEEK